MYLNSKSIQLLSFFFIMLLFSHVFACLYYYITLIESTDNNWLVDNSDYIGSNNHYLGRADQSPFTGPSRRSAPSASGTSTR